MKLNELSDNPGARKPRTRVGRGIGSGKGKTAGRGVKGQKSRSGVAIKGFEGGQMPLHRRLPKRGFVSRNRLNFAEINLSQLQTAVDVGKIKAKADVTEAMLLEIGLVRRILDGVRLLGNGELKTALKLEITGASAAAIAAVEKAGGSISVSRPPKAKADEKENKDG